MELVSVLIPCYNNAPTLARCLDSVLAQTYPCLEVIVVDDGSTDGSAGVVRDYMQKDARVKLICQQNAGVSAARNRAMREAHGDYLQFLDADDEILPQMTQTLLTALQKEHADAAACNYFGNPMFLSDLGDRVYDLRKTEDLTHYTQETFGFLMTWNKLFRADVLQKVRFEESVHFAEDELFNLAALPHLTRVVTVSQALHHYHCAAAENGMSCMQKLASDANFAKEKSSIWYRGKDLLPYRRKILANGRQTGLSALKDPEVLLYARVFDFMIWEFSAYAFLQVPLAVLAEEMGNVFAEKEFLHSYCIFEKYGLRFRRYPAAQWKHAGADYAAQCLACYHATKGTALRHSELFYLLFLKNFAYAAKEPLSDLYALTRRMEQLRTSSTPEARYINAFYCRHRAARTQAGYAASRQSAAFAQEGVCVV